MAMHLIVINTSRRSLHTNMKTTTSGGRGLPPPGENTSTTMDIIELKVTVRTRVENHLQVHPHHRHINNNHNKISSIILPNHLLDLDPLIILHRPSLTSKDTIKTKPSLKITEIHNRSSSSSNMLHTHRANDEWRNADVRRLIRRIMLKVVMVQAPSRIIV